MTKKTKVYKKDDYIPPFMRRRIERRVFLDHRVHTNNGTQKFSRMATCFAEVVQALANQQSMVWLELFDVKVRISSLRSYLMFLNGDADHYFIESLNPRNRALVENAKHIFVRKELFKGHGNG